MENLSINTPIKFEWVDTAMMYWITDKDGVFILAVRSKDVCRRLVAAFNACEGLSIETLESEYANQVLTNFASTVTEFSKMKSERAALGEMLMECLNQIKYLHEKFTPTGTSESVISRTETLLQKLES